MLFLSLHSAARLLQRMTELGISQYDPDPVAAAEGREGERRMTATATIIEKPLAVSDDIRL